MITLTRSLARKLRAVFRRALSLPSRGEGLSVVLETGPGGLVARAQTELAAIEYHQPGVFPPEKQAVPYMLLVDSEGAKETPVTIEAAGKNRLVCQWHEKQVPVMVPYDALPLPKQPFPPRPVNLISNEPGFLSALDDAMATADKGDDCKRYSIQCVLLWGEKQKLAATNGRQLLEQSGYHFPWTEELLIPPTTFFGAKELPADLPVHVGKSDDWVTFIVGPWTLHLATQKVGRFPRYQDVIRDPDEAVAKLEISPGDAKFLLDNLRHLPRSEFDVDHPVTIEANGTVALRATADELPHPTELVLTNSRCTGEPVRINSDRRFLARALGLGLTEIRLFGNEGPLQCGDGRRTYLWMSLSAEGAFAPDDEAVRITSPLENGSISPTTISPSTNSAPMRKKKEAPSAADTPAAPAAEPSNGHVPHDNPLVGSVATTPSDTLPPATSQAAEPGEPAGTAIEQALALRDSLRSVLAQTTELVMALRREKKQARLVATTLASLRQLQAVP